MLRSFGLNSTLYGKFRQNPDGSYPFARSGMTSLLLRLNDIERTRQVVKAEEYRSQFRIYDILNYLDGYTLELPCRYSNKQACFTKVYILSNVDITEQYPPIQIEEPETWAAFMRRINKVIKFPPKINYEQITIYGLIELNTHPKTPFDL